MIVLRMTRTLAQRAVQLCPVHTSLFLAEEGHPEVASTLAGGELDGKQVNVPPLVVGILGRHDQFILWVILVACTHFIYIHLLIYKQNC